MHWADNLTSILFLFLVDVDLATGWFLRFFFLSSTTSHRTQYRKRWGLKTLNDARHSFFSKRIRGISLWKKTKHLCRFSGGHRSRLGLKTTTLMQANQLDNPRLSTAAALTQLIRPERSVHSCVRVAPAGRTRDHPSTCRFVQRRHALPSS